MTKEMRERIEKGIRELYFYRIFVALQEFEILNSDLHKEKLR